VPKTDSAKAGALLAKQAPSNSGWPISVATFEQVIAQLTGGEVWRRRDGARADAG
jgi:hypothetical protein